jgi:hypothetical protein
MMLVNFLKKIGKCKSIISYLIKKNSKEIWFICSNNPRSIVGDLMLP